MIVRPIFLHSQFCYDILRQITVLRGEVMKDTYTISELAGFFNISAQTLRHYDKIGLLKPSIIGSDNNYRMYDRKNFRKLYLIVELRSLGLSLKEIREYCAKKDMEQLEATLQKSSAALEKEIEELTAMRRHVESYLQKIRLSRGNYKNLYEIKLLPDRHTYFIPANFEISDLELYMALLLNSYRVSCSGQKRQSLKRIVLTIEQTRLEARRFRLYGGIGFLLEHPVQSGNHHTIPGGMYACAYHMGGYDTIHVTYKKLWDYLTEHDYSIAGNSTEISIADIAFTDNPENYITEIQIPVKEADSRSNNRIT